MTSVYALPIPSRESASTSKPSLKKRKQAEVDGQPADLGGEQSLNEASEHEEYTAVLTPNERSQRRLAGHSLVKNLPCPPFPHRAQKKKDQSSSTSHTTEEVHDAQNSQRLQHLSSMSAVLHRSLLKKDYARARRALGLILRTDVSGKPVDIRAAGNWAIGAEILFCQHEQHPSQGESVELRCESRKRRFAEAKSFYEALVVQYPFQRSRPDSVNTLDFYLAIFNLWIYVTQAETHELSDSILQNGHQHDGSGRNQVKLWVLEKAIEIGVDMDRRMVGAPYSDNKDLLRLRAMVADWQADLCEDCEADVPIESVVEAKKGGSSTSYTATMEDLSLSEDHTTSQRLSQIAIEARRKANKIYARLELPASLPS